MPIRGQLVQCCCCCRLCWSYRQCADWKMTTWKVVRRRRRRPAASWRTRHPWTSSGGPGGARSFTWLVGYCLATSYVVTHSEVATGLLNVALMRDCADVATQPRRRELAGQRLGMEGTALQQPQTPLPLLRYVMAGFICSRSNELANYPLCCLPAAHGTRSHFEIFSSSAKPQSMAVMAVRRAPAPRGRTSSTYVRTNVRTSFPLKKQDMKHDAKTSAPAASTVHEARQRNI